MIFVSLFLLYGMLWQQQHQQVFIAAFQMPLPLLSSFTSSKSSLLDMGEKRRKCATSTSDRFYDPYVVTNKVVVPAITRRTQQMKLYGSNAGTTSSTSSDEKATTGSNSGTNSQDDDDVVDDDENIDNKRNMDPLMKSSSYNKLYESVSKTIFQEKEEHTIMAINNDKNNNKNGLMSSYVQYAKTYPFMNNVVIATIKTMSADVLAQTVIGHTSLLELDLQRCLLFCIFGALYLGAFQYMYQVQVFKKIFPNIDTFTNQSIRDKVQNQSGIRTLVGQTIVDLTVLSIIYLPTFYIFKAIVFNDNSDIASLSLSSFNDPAAMLGVVTSWIKSGINNYQMNFGKDEIDLLRVWLPADLICFSVPLYLRLPVRHIVSFVWTAYLSFAQFR